MFSHVLQFCNMFEHLSPSEWLLYISEWNDGTQQASNIRVTTKVAVNALLHSNQMVSEPCPLAVVCTPVISIKNIDR